MSDPQHVHIGHRRNVMTPERWERITDLLGHVLDLSSEHRAAFLGDLHLVEPEIAAEVQSLLFEDEKPGDFLPPLPVTPVADDLRGRVIGAYRLTRLLGSGGMGAVYLAERSDGSFVKQVAIKLLSPALGHASDWFRRERELLARLDHPNIARLIDGGTTAEGWPYLVMEYVEGAPIDRYCEERGLALKDRLRLLVQVCSGLTHAHQRLVVHCDVKPANILVTGDGMVKLLDFGIAKFVDPEKTMTQCRPGTPAYASPEQIRGETLTTASDMYSLGVLAYVVLTGQWPYPGRSGQFAEAVRAVLESEPILASRLPGLAPARMKQLRGDLDNVLAKAVAKDPVRRYASVQQFADDLESYCQGLPVRARPDTLSYRLSKFVQRHRVATVLGSAAAAVLIAATSISTSQARIAQRRFDDLRTFAHAVVFDVNDAMATSPGTTASRKLLVETALRYLDRLAQERSADTSLREELAAAYLRVARVQGGAFQPNLGDTAGAIASFQKAIAATGSSPATPVLARLRMEAHISIAQLATDPLRGADDFERAIEAGTTHLAKHPSDADSLRLVAASYHGKATIGHLTDNVPQHEQHVIRALEFRQRVIAAAPGSWRDEIELAREHAQHALALVQKGDPAAAVAALERADRLLATLHERLPANQLVTRGLAEIRHRFVTPLLKLDRIWEAESKVTSAIALLEPIVASDVDNRQYRSDLASAWLQLGAVRRAQGRLDEALALQRKTLDTRRRAAHQENTTMFVPWGFATVLNGVGELLLEQSIHNWREARELFSEARAVAEERLALAPSFNELRKELAISYEGLARTTIAEDPNQTGREQALLARSLATWDDVFARSVGDRRHQERQAHVRSLIESSSTRTARRAVAHQVAARAHDRVTASP
jgi:non-specific serine/threonine protein kinase/serine/threonine-protein kinase